jgi:L-alanine-DL-glutamate epimerase-like enolase superfamily enzyme
MLAEPLRPSADGVLAVPERPGLGFELDDEALERYTVS